MKNMLEIFPICVSNSVSYQPAYGNVQLWDTPPGTYYMDMHVHNSLDELGIFFLDSYN